MTTKQAESNMITSSSVRTHFIRNDSSILSVQIAIFVQIQHILHHTPHTRTTTHQRATYMSDTQWDLLYCTTALFPYLQLLLQLVMVDDDVALRGKRLQAQEAATQHYCHRARYLFEAEPRRESLSPHRHTHIQ